MKFFWDETKGVNADLARHKQQELELLKHIEQLKDKTDEFSLIHLKTYQGLLDKLLVSKAEVASKIGKKSI